MSINTMEDVMHKGISNKTNDEWYSIKECYISHEIHKDFRTPVTWMDWNAIKINALNFLLNDRLENYDYDYQSWNRLKNQRDRVRAILKVADTTLLHWIDISHRFEVNLDDSSIRYNVSQSRNEEITNLIKTLIYGTDSNKFKNNN